MFPIPVVCAALIAAQPVQPVPVPDPAPLVTQTKTCRPGDPVNLRLIGTRAELVAAFCAAGWSVADPINVRSSLRIGVSVALNRPYAQAPVSDLYLFGRTQDIAFERSVTGSARTRHHVRFWQDGCTTDGRPIWVGAGTFDCRVGRSPATGRLTHRIAPDVDTERDTILADLTRAGRLADGHVMPRGGPFSGANGEGDCYFTDGGIGEGVLAADCCPAVVVTTADCCSRRRR
jgi:hypothetical protein